MLRACSMILPGRLIRENRMAFILFGAHDLSSTRRFIALLRLKARIMIHHQAALAPKREEGRYPPRKVLLHDRMGLFGFP